MSLQQKISDDLKKALKSGDSMRLGTLRLISSAFHNREIEKKTKKLEASLSEEDAVEVLRREAKKRKEAIEVYAKGNREDLAQKEKNELAIIKAYLPEEVSSEEIGKVVEAAIERVGATNVKDFGRVMGEAMKELRGGADSTSISEIIKQKLQ